VAKTVVLCAYNVANFPNGGGHLWVYMQHVFGMKRLGCDVYWLECFRRSGDAERDAAAIDSFFARLAAMGMAGRVILRKVGGPDPAAPVEWLGLSEAEAGRVIDRADLMLNFHYAIEPELLARFRRTAMVDIDPGLFQFWLSRGQLKVPRHDLYFTTGETVGTPGARFPDCGLEWVRIPPAVCVEPGRQPGRVTRRHGDDGTDRAGRVGREVALQRLGDLPAPGAGRQRPGVDPAERDPQERQAEHQQHRDDADRVEHRAAHHAVRQAQPPAALGRGGARGRPGGAREAEPGKHFRVDMEFSISPLRQPGAGHRAARLRRPELFLHGKKMN